MKNIMINHTIKPVQWLGLTVLLLLATGCTEEKALGLRSVAVQYRDHAVRALNLVANGVRSATAMPARTAEDLVAKLKVQTRPLDAATLEFLLTSDAALARATGEATKPLEVLRGNVTALAAIFENLPQGSYLSKDEVARTLPLILRLNQSLLNLAQQIDAGTIRMTDNVRRIEVIEAANVAIAMPAGDKRDTALRRTADALLDLTEREHQMQQEAAVALLQAAEIGNELIRLARDYEQISIKDLLSGLNDALQLAGQISPESKSIKQALSRLQATTKALEEDPVLKPLLAQPVRENP